MYSKEERKIMLGIARRSIEKTVGGKDTAVLPAESPDFLSQMRGAFVTLHKHGALRGCIGHVEPIKPLEQAIAYLAVESAVHDPRFPSLESLEIDDIDIEISVMTPPEPLTDPTNVIVGKHGLIIRRGSSSGLLLPQVATQYGWEAETFLEHTCRKAGLPGDAWRDPETQIMTFEAEVFGEKEKETPKHS